MEFELVIPMQQREEDCDEPGSVKIEGTGPFLILETSNQFSSGSVFINRDEAKQIADALLQWSQSTG